jgi:protein-L-isoaspartate O-methyltransferase
LVAGIDTQARRRALAALAAISLACPALAQEPPVNAPFITTPDEVVDRMLRLARTRPTDTVMDLGSGDGRIVISAAKAFGARGIGVEIDARLVERSRQNARSAGVAERVEILQGDVLRTELGRASVVTVYLLPQLIDRLQPKFLDELKPGARIVTHAFSMKGWRPDASEIVTLSKPHPSQGDRSEIFLWIVPAQVRGEWEAKGWQLRISQNFQEVEVEGEAAGGRFAPGRAQLSGETLSFNGEARGRPFSFGGRVQGNRISGELTVDGVQTPLVFTKR